MTIKKELPKQKSKEQYRDHILRKLCQDGSRIIELCNAVTGSNYSADTKVKLHNLENSLVRRYNDIAVAVEDELLVMIEHSTNVSPNMPLRLLSYTTDILYTWYVVVKELYKNKIFKIPTPKFYLLYNGTDPVEEKTLKLSAAFETDGGENSLELVVHVIDINYTSGNEVLNKSESLKGYAYLIEQINNYKRQGLSRDEAIHAAIKHCIEAGVLADFLKTHYEEVADMLNIQYDQEVELEALREEAKDEGKAEGRAEGRAEGIEQSIGIMRDLAIDEDIIAQKLKEKFQLNDEGVKRFLEL